MKWRRLRYSKRQEDVIWFRFDGRFRLQVNDSGQGTTWAFTIGRDNRIVRCEPFAAATAEEAMARADLALADCLNSVVNVRAGGHGPGRNGTALEG